jgi:hypothetical protein
MIEQRVCTTCGAERPFSLNLNFSYAHLYWLFKVVTSKKYFLACDVCHCGWALKAKEVESKLPKNPLPFLTRFGWALLVIPVAFIILANA